MPASSAYKSISPSLAALPAGLALMMFCLHNQLLYPATLTFSGSNLQISYPFSLVYSAIVLALSAFLAICRKRQVIEGLRDRRMLLATGIAGALGMVVVSQLLFASPFETLLVGAGVALISMFIVHHLGFWLWQISCQPKETALICMFVSFSTAYALTGAASAFQISSIAVMAAVAVASGLLARFAPAASCEQTAIPRESSEAKTVKWALWAASLLFVFLGTAFIEFYNVTSKTSPPSARYLLYVADTAVSLIALAYACLKRKSDPERSTLAIFALCTAALAASILLASIFSATRASFAQFSLVAGKNLFEGFILLLAAMSTSEDEDRRGTVAFLAIALGIALPHTCSALVRTIGGLPALAAADLVSAFALASVGALAVCVAALAIFVFVVTQKAGEPIAEPQQAEPQDVSAQRKIDAAVQAWGLSQRESDVALLAYRNYSAQRMANELFISTGTVNSHLKHIYRKADVHSRDELIDALNRLS